MILYKVIFYVCACVLVLILFVFFHSFLFNFKASICAAGDSAAYQRKAAFGDDVVIVA